MKICFGTVAYNNPHDIQLWLSHLRALAPVELIAVSDNSTDLMLAKQIQDICFKAGADYLADGGNLGYFAGLNRILIAHPGNDAYVLGNSDLTYDTNLIKNLEALDLSGLDVIAPKILSKHCNDLNPYMLKRESKLELAILHAKFSSYSMYLTYAFLYQIGLIPMIEKMAQGNLPKHSGQIKIWGAHGSCFILTSGFISKCKLLPDQNFLWLEENMLAIHAMKHGAQITYIPELLVHHDGRGTTSKLGRRTKYEIKKKSFHNYLKLLAGEFDEET